MAEPAKPSRGSRRARVEQIVDHNGDTRSLFLHIPDTGLKFVPGQFISISIPLGDETRTRAYSIASNPQDGALIEAAARLFPGRIVELQVERAGQRMTLRGRLLRCTVAGLQSSAVCYRAAMVFDDRLNWLDDSPLDDATQGTRPQPQFSRKHA